MAGKVLDVEATIQPDNLGREISNFWIKWRSLRQEAENEWRELREYLFATDTRKTSNAKLKWKNTTTTPKLTQLRDNLLANYTFAMFPKQRWLIWDADTAKANEARITQAIKSYMNASIVEPAFKQELIKCILDYIDYGNAFGMAVWKDQRVLLEDEEKAGFVGPGMLRISPLDIAFNPIASDFESSPKIIRSIVTLGEVKKMLEAESTEENQEAVQALWAHINGLRRETSQFAGDLSQKDHYLRVDGFSSWQEYLDSDYVEILTFYGDTYDADSGEFLENHIIQVVDRHKVISKRPNPSAFGRAAIHHVGWRKRQDNLWAMGPLANLVGLQYRIDHIENLKADVFDLITFPPLKIKGYVDDFEWGPFAKIYVSEEGDVEMMAPPFQVLQANIEIDRLINLMEELAGAPKTALGFRTPGEKTAEEVRRLENAAGRIFQHKSAQFEEDFLEPLLNDMLELGRRNVTRTQAIKIFNDEFQMNDFLQVTPEDLQGAGRIRPIAARHFAEQSQLINNLNMIAQTPIGQDPMVMQHFSSIRMAKMLESLLELEDYELVQPYVRIGEQADAERIKNSALEQVSQEAMTSSGLTPDDYDLQGDLASGTANVGVDQALQNPEGQGIPPGGNPQ